MKKPCSLPTCDQSTAWGFLGHLPDTERGMRCSSVFFCRSPEQPTVPLLGGSQ